MSLTRIDKNTKRLNKITTKQKNLYATQNNVFKMEMQTLPKI